MLLKPSSRTWRPPQRQATSPHPRYVKGARAASLRARTSFCVTPSALRRCSASTAARVETCVLRMRRRQWQGQRRASSKFIATVQAVPLRATGGSAPSLTAAAYQPCLLALRGCTFKPTLAATSTPAACFAAADASGSPALLPAVFQRHAPAAVYARCQVTAAIPEYMDA
jgi:hypothetical protein